jgi:hypothetical protein
LVKAGGEVNVIFMGRDPLKMGYLDNLHNQSSNKYEKNLKNKKIS